MDGKRPKFMDIEEKAAEACEINLYTLYDL